MHIFRYTVEHQNYRIYPIGLRDGSLKEFRIIAANAVRRQIHAIILRGVKRGVPHRTGAEKMMPFQNADRVFSKWPARIGKRNRCCNTILRQESIQTGYFLFDLLFGKFTLNVLPTAPNSPRPWKGEKISRSQDSAGKQPTGSCLRCC